MYLDTQYVGVMSLARTGLLVSLKPPERLADGKDRIASKLLRNQLGSSLFTIISIHDERARIVVLDSNSIPTSLDAKFVLLNENE